MDLAAKITPRRIELTYEAVLKSFWRRNALKKFLLASHVKERKEAQERARARDVNAETYIPRWKLGNRPVINR